jgi:hypothetical protein
MTALRTDDTSTAPLLDEPERAGARLMLLAAEEGHATTLDGAWWPRSTSLATDLPPLVAELRRRGVRITRAAYHPELWEPAPRKIRADNRIVRLGWFRTIDPHLVSLTGSGGERVELLVVPPDTAPAAAARAMALAATRGNRSSPTAVLAAAEVSDVGNEASPVPASRSAADSTTTRQQPRASDADDRDPDLFGWESEGGFGPR